MADSQDAAISQIMEMGFSSNQARIALKKSNNDVNNAVNILLAGDVDENEANEPYDHEFEQAIYKSMNDTNDSEESLTQKMSTQESGVFSSDLGVETSNTNYLFNSNAYSNNNSNYEPSTYGPPPSPLPRHSSAEFEHREEASRTENFGPATKDNYSENKWGIVTTNYHPEEDKERCYSTVPPRSRKHGE